MNTESIDALNLRFTSRELAELISMIGAPPFLGVKSKLKAGMDDLAAAAVRETVQQSLLARGALIRSMEDVITIDRTIEKLLMLCVHPEYRVVILGRRGSSAIPQYEVYYLIENLTIRQLEALPDIFDLTVFKTRPHFSDSIAAYCVNETATDSEAVSLPYATFRTIEQRLADGSIAGVLELLNETGVQAQTGRTLCDVLAGYTMKVYLEIANVHDQSTNAMTFVYSESGCLEVNGLEAEGCDEVVLQLITRETHRQRSERFFEALTSE